MVWSPGSPDPDFLAAAEVVRRIGLKLGCSVRICGAKPLSLDVNRRMVKDFSIPYRLANKSDFTEIEGLIILDYARAAAPPMASSLPLLLHIDHHQQQDSSAHVHHRIIDQEIGAVSTLFGEWLMNAEEPWLQEILANCATILYYAIQVDTDALLHAHERDRKVSEFLRPLIHQTWLERNLRLRLSEFQQVRLRQGIEKAREEDGVLFCGLGILPSTERDFIAISSDLLIRRKGVDLTAVYAMIKGKEHLTLDVSLRSKSERIDLHDLIKRITSEGGARPFKGAYQINMDYFLPLIESEELWQLVEDSTHIHIISALSPAAKRAAWSSMAAWIRRLGKAFTQE